jgi:WD40 repeat protein
MQSIPVPPAALLFEFSLYLDAIYSLKLNPADKTQFATGSGDDTAILWKVGQTEPLHHLKGHKDTVQRVAFNFDGKILATACMDATVKLWDTTTGELKFTLEGPSAEIEMIDWHKKGNAILAASSDATVWLWNANSGEYLNAFTGHEGPVTHCAFSADGTVSLIDNLTGA